MITQITSLATHTTILQHAETSGQPTIFYVSNSALPAYKTFTPKYEALARRYAVAAGAEGAELSEEARHRLQVHFTQMEISPSTSMLFKFAPNQLPVLTLICREKHGDGKDVEDREGGGSGNLWCKTVMGADMRGLEEGIDEMLSRAGIQVDC